MVNYKESISDTTLELLVSFGKYMVSAERWNSIEAGDIEGTAHEREAGREVTDADLDNWYREYNRTAPLHGGIWVRYVGPDTDEIRMAGIFSGVIVKVTWRGAESNTWAVSVAGAFRAVDVEEKHLERI